ncbi:hypothetical protein [Burkholderia sp. BCC1977]|uniref:hypothetical protein n=1 Tax=Burkholderia sp. BCC1977 TaxID=2817440 RepID=UPI002ABD8C0B|nr:hypothetical protein [Burkholderia sp. BCC1977]
MRAIDPNGFGRRQRDHDVEAAAAAVLRDAQDDRRPEPAARRPRSDAAMEAMEAIAARAGMLIPCFVPVSLPALRLPDAFFTPMTFRARAVVAIATAILSARKVACRRGIRGRARPRPGAHDRNRSPHGSRVI